MSYAQIMMEYRPIWYLLIGIVAITLIIKTAMALLEFVEVRKYIKMEIKRSSSDAEVRYWKKRMRRLYKSYIPKIFRKRG